MSMMFEMAQSIGWNHSDYSTNEINALSQLQLKFTIYTQLKCRRSPI